MTDQTDQKKILISFFLVALIIILAWLFSSRTMPTFLSHTGWLFLLSSLTLLIIKSRHVTSKSTKGWLMLAIIGCIAIALTYSSLFRGRIEKRTQNTTSISKTSEKSVKITPTVPAPANPSEVKETDWGRLIKFTGREPDGVQLYKTTEKGDLYKFTIVGKSRIIDNSKGDTWPAWGADGFAPGWRKYFLYENIGIMPNAVVIIFGKPGNAKMEHVYTFNRNKTEITIESPEDGLPLYLYYNEPVVNGDYYCFENNRGYATIQVEKL